MDSDLLESWGKLLIGTAKTQRQYEQLLGWTHQWYRCFGGLMNFFSGPQAMNQAVKGSAFDLDIWKQSEESLRNFGSYLRLFGLVPMSEHMELLRKYEELKDKCAVQERALAFYQMMEGEAGATEGGSLMKQFQDLAFKQTQQNLNLIDNFKKLFSGSE